MTTTQFDEILHMMETHGLSLVLLIFIIGFWLVPWIKSMQKRDAVRSAKEEDHLELQIKYEAEINKILALASDNIKCQWAVLWQFHNSASTIGGIPFLKMSVTNEHVALDYAPRSELYQQIPVSVFLEPIVEIRDKDYLVVCADENLHPAISNSYKRDGVACGYFMRVNDIQGRMIGILSCSYANGDISLGNKEISTMKGYASRLGMALAQISAVQPQKYRRKEDNV